MAKRKWLPCRLNKSASTIPDMAETPVKESPAKKEKFEWADEGLSALVRVIILGWSAAILTLNYVSIPGGKGDQTAVTRGYGKSFAVASGLPEEEEKAAIKFLKHISRTGLLLIFVDLFPSEDLDPVKQINLLTNELDSFKDNLTQKVSWIICNKIDLIQEDEIAMIRKEIETKLSKPAKDIFFISAATGEGTIELLKSLETEVIGNKEDLA